MRYETASVLCKWQQVLFFMKIVLTKWLRGDMVNYASNELCN